MEPSSSRLVRNSALNLSSQIVATLVAIVCLPITFRELGTERFALLTLVWSLLTYGTLFDFGFGRSVARSSAAALAHDQVEQIGGILKAAALVQLLIGFAAMAGLILATPWLLEQLKVPTLYQADVARAMRYVAAALPVLLIFQSLQGVMEALGRFDWLTAVRTPIAVSTYLVPALGAVAGWSLATIFLILLVLRVAAALVLHAVYLRMRLRRGAGAARPHLRQLFSFGGWLTVSTLVIGVMMYADRFLLAAFGSLDDVTQFTAPYDLAAKLLIVPGSIGAVLFPALSWHAALERHAEADQRSRAATRATVYLMLPISLILIAGAGPLLRYWLGAEISEVGIAAFRILVLANALHALSFMPVVAIEGMGRSSVVAKYHLVELPVYLVLVAAAIRWQGTIGAAYAWLARSVWLVIWANWYVWRGVRVQPAPLPASAAKVTQR